jgi:hypothetical protein
MMRFNYFNRNKKNWSTPILIQINIELVKQEINQQDAELLNLIATDENTFRLLSGSTN